MTAILSRNRVVGYGLLLLAMALTAPAHAADLKWKGFDWDITDGGMAGVAEGAASNVSVDANDWLHLKITKNGDSWSASELFTTQKLGFGTYQWQIEGPIDTFDKNNVLGLFPYGPAAGIGGDGTNEIDIEFSRWGIATAPNADFTDYPASGTVVGETTFKFSLGGSTSSTARFTWTPTSIESSVLKGHQAIASETDLLKKWTYAPNDPSVNIPQQALPLGINLWCFDAPPSDGQNVEIVIRDFQFVKEGDPLPGSGGAGAGGAAGAANGGAANGGRAGAANAGAANAGAANAGAANAGTANGGAAGMTALGGANDGGSGGALPTAGDGAISAGGPTAGNMGHAGSAGSTAPSGGTPTAGTGNANANVTGSDGTNAGCACQTAGAAHTQSAWTALASLALLRLRRRSRA